MPSAEACFRTGGIYSERRLIVNYYLRKIISFILTILCVALLSFLMFQVLPGDAAIARLGTEATPEAIEALRAEYGYDRPVGERFKTWLSGAVKGDFGMSMRYEGISVTELIGSRLPVTLTLAGMSIALIALVSLPVGLLCAAKPQGAADRISEAASVTFMAIPSFVTGLLITLIFGIWIKAFTPGGYVSPSVSPAGFIRFMIFPAISVAIPKIAMTVQYMKASVKEQLSCDYVRTAKAKGNNLHGIMWKHVLGNSMMPVITFIGLIVAEVLAGSIMIEQVFNLPGMGRLLVNSIANRDFNVVQAIVLYIAASVLLVNLIVDIIYKIIDPRV